jgi:hypothetical protein
MAFRLKEKECFNYTNITLPPGSKPKFSTLGMCKAIVPCDGRVVLSHAWSIMTGKTFSDAFKRCTLLIADVFYYFLDSRTLIQTRKKPKQGIILCCSADITNCCILCAPRWDAYSNATHCLCWVKWGSMSCSFPELCALRSRHCFFQVKVCASPGLAICWQMDSLIEVLPEHITSKENCPHTAAPTALYGGGGSFPSCPSRSWSPL